MGEWMYGKGGGGGTHTHTPPCDCVHFALTATGSYTCVRGTKSHTKEQGLINIPLPACGRTPSSTHPLQQKGKEESGKKRGGAWVSVSMRVGTTYIHESFHVVSQVQRVLWYRSNTSCGESTDACAHVMYASQTAHLKGPPSSCPLPLPSESNVMRA